MEEGYRNSPAQTRTGSHSTQLGIPGNEQADKAAKEAAQSPLIEITRSPHPDLRPLAKKFTNLKWQERWNNCVENKLHRVHPSISSRPKTFKCRRDEVVWNRISIGHTYLTHGYLLRGEPAPECAQCQCIQTVEHILVDCPNFDDERDEFLQNANTMENLFGYISSEDILQFLRSIGHDIFQSM